MLFVLFIPGAILLFQMGYNESFLLLNAFHHPFLDSLMRHLTHIGEGALLTAIFALIWRKKNPALVACLGIAMLLVLVLVSPLKHQLFESWARPLAYFPKEKIHYAVQIDLYAHAFPSGHSAAAACMLAFFAVAFKDRRWAICMAWVAAFAAYTRVYVGAHFLGDVLAGGLLGMGIAAFVFYFLYDRLFAYFEKPGAKNPKWQLFFLLAALLTLGISLYELIRTYYL